MRKTVRLFVLFEGIAFIIASLTHFGILMHGYEHRAAGTAEGVIGIVLLIGFLLTWLIARWTRGIITTIVMSSCPPTSAKFLGLVCSLRPGPHL